MRCAGSHIIIWPVRPITRWGRTYRKSHDPQRLCVEIWQFAVDSANEISQRRLVAKVGNYLDMVCRYSFDFNRDYVRGYYFSLRYELKIDTACVFLNKVIIDLLHQ